MDKLQNIKIVAVDLDGTLLRSDRTISDKTKECFTLLQEQGITPIIATGRSYEALEPIKKELGLDTAVICYNGAMVVDGKTGKVLHEWFLPSHITKRANEIALDRDIHFQGFKNGQLLLGSDKAEGQFYEQSIGLKGLRVNFETLSDEQLTLTKALYILQPERTSKQWPELYEIQKQLQDEFGDTLYTAISQPYFLELINGQCSKGAALKYIAESMGYTAENVMAFGDALNDMEMLEYAGHGVAMKNSLPQVLQSIPNHTTYNHNEDGVAQYLMETVLTFGACRCNP